MEMEMAAAQEEPVIAETATDKLIAAASALEAAAERLAGVGLQAGREAELERRLAEAEAAIAAMKTAARKTVAGGAGSLMAKEGSAEMRPGSGAVDAALQCLSVEQRIAVKAGLMRAGLI